ncbi:MAG TPA: hypothetical protein VI758_09965, partial [Bacteroidota bacterium]
MGLGLSRRILYSSSAILCLASVHLYPQENSRASTGVIRGKIDISRPDDVTEEIMRGRMLNRYEAGSGLSEKPFQPYTLPEKAVVYLEAVPGHYSPPEVHPTLDQHDMVFRPLVLPVLVGTTVDFPN